MKKYKVCVYAICKNEEIFADKWMDSMNEADEIIVTDTGSSDNTVKILRERGANVHETLISPWRFDTARNISLSHVPDDTDICVCTDLDEVFESGWRDKLEEAWKPGVSMANYTYNWSVNPDGTPGVQFTYFKIHARKDYTWIHPVHECLNYIGGRVESKVFADITLNHFPDQEKSRGSYLPLLELAVAETPNEPRMLYYLGREYMYKKKWEECVSTLEKYLTLSQWDDERSAAMRWIAAAHRFSGDVPAAFRWYLRAIAEQPVIRDGYIELAETARNITPPDWKTVFWAAESALAIPERSKTFTNMPYSWNHTPYDLASLACFYLGLIDKAEDYARKAAERAPGDERICNNLTLIRNTYR